MTQLENNSLFLTYELEGGIIINFYECANDDVPPLERVHLEKERNGKVIRKQIINLYCDKCKEVWLNGLINEYDDFDQRAIKIGRLLICNNIFEVCDMVREFDFSEEFKKEIIEAYVEFCTKKKSKISINVDI